MNSSDLNFSLWCDFVERGFLRGEFQSLLKDNVIRGATSNPSIFQKVLGSSSEYDAQKKELAGLAPKELYEELATTDIRECADILRSYIAYKDDGFISLEVDPNLCNDKEGTVAEGKRLFEKIGRENVMIKVPATQAGYGAITELVQAGINVNATLVFSNEQSERVLEAFAKGSAGEDGPHGVISIFVSRFDRACDALFEKASKQPGRLGIMNAQHIYNNIQASGITSIRPLFASTGVKGDAYPKSYYIDKLLLRDAINTAPLETIDAWLKEGSQTEARLYSEEEIGEFFRGCQEIGIDIEALYAKLLEDGLSAFVESFDGIIETLGSVS